MLKTKALLGFFIFLLLFSWFTSSGIWKRIKANNSIHSKKKYTSLSTAVEKLKKKSTEAISFIKKNGYNESVCFFIDMTLPSGQNRFFVYNVVKDSIQSSGLVTHGRCNEMWLEGRKYSNEPGCGCTSLGKYKIGNLYIGRFGLAFKLYGLDKTNNNAFKRFVVLHSHECVPETEVQDEICQSDGCPTVSPQFLQQLKPLIKQSLKPILLWIIE
jgi:L,D-transpeptidase catalytic domain